jgi:hypothetical protein
LASSSLDEHDIDQFSFGMAALQTHDDRIDTLLSVFTRFAITNFVPGKTAGR